MRVDEIKQELIVSAPIETVWNAITSAKELSEWFGDSAEVDLKPGGSASFGWSEYDAVVKAVVETVERPHKFAYRWAAQKADVLDETNSTVVEFELTTTDDGTLVQLTESGFSTLPEDVRLSSFRENKSGWEVELDHLKEYLATIRPMV